MFADPVPGERQSNRTARVAMLLKGNNALHDVDSADLRAFLDGAPGRLAKYDEKMELLLKDVNDLHKERDEFQCRIQEARNLLHPVRTLSDDVLGEIFAHCFPEWEALERKLLSEPTTDYSSLNSSYAPWTLSQVCSRWRRVTLSTPRLWSTIMFTSPAFPARKKALSRELGRLNRFCYNLGLFMSRSGNVDLSVAITVLEDETIPDMVFTHLAVGAARWRRLCFRANGNRFPAALSGLDFERLEEAILSSDIRVMDGKRLASFRAAPRLRRLYLDDEARSRVFLPWSRITHYERVIYAHEWTLPAMPNLTHLFLRVIGYPRVPVGRSKLSFPNLLSLSIEPCTDIFFSALLLQLEVPALTDLRLTTYRLSKSKSITLSLPVTDMFPKQLTSIHIAYDAPKFRDADSASLTSWLQLATDVTALSIHLPNILDALLRDLRVHAKNDVLVPRLRSLDLWVTAKDAQMSPSKVLSVLESRSGLKQNVSRLEEFCTNVDANRFSEGRLQRWQDVCRKVKVICPR
ncbi:hypothetical protein BDZ89DRAFT_1157001 [Hymenopellis radicata]|nr:hypothetical protein BDZ89DRAFT_1157001 [Hymenopellis radicata]